MNALDVRKAAFAMPLHSPSYPIGPYRFIDREYMIISYRTDRELLERIVPEPLHVIEPVVRYQFVRMPSSTGVGSYTGSAQMIPVRFKGEVGTYTHAMYLDAHRRSRAAASSGDFLKSSPRQPCGSNATRSSAPWISVQSALPLAPWDTSTGLCRKSK